MPTGSNVKLELDPLPTPDDTPVKAEEDRQGQKMQQAQKLPQGAGFASKGADVGYLANNLLAGWMAGRHIKQQKELEKAKTDVTQSRAIYDHLAQSYSENLNSGQSKDSPEMKKMSESITAAWTNYLNTADKYTTPTDEEGKDKKKTAGQKVKGALGGDVHPEMYRQASLQILRKQGPPVLTQDVSKQQKVANQAADVEMQGMKDKDEWRNLAQVPVDKRTKEQQTRLDSLEATIFPKSYEQQVRDTLMKKVMDGGKGMSKEERQMAENFGMLKPGVTSTITWKDSKGEDYMISIGPDGQEVGRRSLGKGYMPPDQVTVSKRIMDQQIDTMVREYKKAYGSSYTDAKKLDEDAHRIALGSVTGYKAFGATPGEAEANQLDQARAIKTVMSEVPKDQRELFQNFVVSPTDDIDGLYMYRSNVADPTGEKTHWFKPNEKTYPGGLTKGELFNQEKEFRLRLFTALRKQHPKETPEQITKRMPQPIYTSPDFGAQPPAPTGAQKSQGMSPTPDQAKGGTQYSDYATDGKGGYVGYNVQTKKWEPVDPSKQ